MGVATTAVPYGLWATNPTKKLAHWVYLLGQPLSRNRVFQNFSGEPPPPLKSIATNHKPCCSKTCIDNIMTNQSPTAKLSSGKLAGKTLNYSPIFQLSEISCQSHNNSQKQKLTLNYKYSNNNIRNFVKETEKKFLNKIPQSFDEFMGTFQKAIDKTCKLDKPKVTKINHINNSWICKGIIESIHKNDQLYNILKGSISKKCPGGNEILKSMIFQKSLK